MTTGNRKSERSTWDKLRSPGRPPVWQRETLCRFWRGVAAGHSREVSAVEAGVSGPVGIRWFRRSGGMPPTHLAPSAISLTSRKLTFSEREEIALECARGSGIRAIARKLSRSSGTVSWEIRRNSATPGATSTIARSRRSGMRIEQDCLSGLIATSAGIAFDGPVVVWKGRRAVHRQSRRWSCAWSPNRSRNV